MKYVNNKIGNGLVHKWKNQLKEKGALIFSGQNKVQRNDTEEEKAKLYQRIGHLTTEIEFLKKSSRRLNRKERLTFINKNNKLSLRRQCEILEINRSSLYYKGKGGEEEDVWLINLIREI